VEKSERSPEYAIAVRRTNRTDIAHPIIINVRCDFPVEIVLILDNTGNHKGPVSSARDFDRFGGALLVVNATKEQQIVTAFLGQSEFFKWNSVMDSCSIIQTWMTISITDRDVTL